MERCCWSGDDPLMVSYHDREWGVPLHDDRKLFEFMVLDAFQAGLSWSIILRKREAFRQAFDGFDPRAVAGYDRSRVESLLADRSIVRNRLKVEATVTNAAQLLRLQREHGSFDAWIWQFTEGRTIHNAWTSLDQIPPRSPESEAMSRTLKTEGFRFVGPTICYAFMQAAGMVNDHLTRCYRYAELGGAAS